MTQKRSVCSSGREVLKGPNKATSIHKFTADPVNVCFCSVTSDNVTLFPKCLLFNPDRKSLWFSRFPDKKSSSGV